ncbi:hypothetical protein KI809_18400 [Geobacter pelophilus]|uniref:Uncharacterized protein n=1 Tax=Geoanaerobacter pelophilus TaxID=60036 RepID=A0AAW4L5L0_9BACT|nr:hypothetical protein [Geoanaerobacter pelophilus]MBT0666286.1 hypothetical protein [Geoanaerobacter pelophilus]
MLKPNIDEFLDHLVTVIRADVATDKSSPRVKSLIANMPDFELKALAWKALQRVTEQEILAKSSLSETLQLTEAVLTLAKLQINN